MSNKVKAIHDFIFSGGRAASIPVPEPLPEARITEMINGVLVSRPVEKVTELEETKDSSSTGFAISFYS